jgi:hypothetical protein
MNTARLAALVGGTLSIALASVASATTVVALTTDNRILTFDHLAPGVTFSNTAVTGLGAGESLLGIDLRPATGQIFALSSASRVYVVNPMTGAASAVGAAFTPGLSASDHSIDFNPTVDRIRVVGAGGENRRLNPLNGQAVTATDTALSYAMGGSVRAAGVAYTNSLAGVLPGSTRQYIIDSATDMLVESGTQAGGNASFNAGVVTSIGSLGFDTTDLVGFDIFGPTGVALLSTNSPLGGASTLRLLNLSDATSISLGDIAGGTIRDITIVPTPAAASVGVLAGLVALRRRRA